MAQEILNRIKTLQKKVDDNLQADEAQAAKASLLAWQALLECEELEIQPELYSDIIDDLQELELACCVESLNF